MRHMGLHGNGQTFKTFRVNDGTTGVIVENCLGDYDFQMLVISQVHHGQEHNALITCIAHQKSNLQLLSSILGYRPLKIMHFLSLSQYLVVWIIAGHRVGVHDVFAAILRPGGTLVCVGVMFTAPIVTCQHTIKSQRSLSANWKTVKLLLRSSAYSIHYFWRHGWDNQAFSGLCYFCLLGNTLIVIHTVYSSCFQAQSLLQIELRPVSEIK